MRFPAVMLVECPSFMDVKFQTAKSKQRDEASKTKQECLDITLPENGFSWLKNFNISPFYLNSATNQSGASLRAAESKQCTPIPHTPLQSSRNKCYIVPLLHRRHLVWQHLLRGRETRDWLPEDFRCLPQTL